MRLFTGIDLPESVIANLSRLIDRLRPAADARWSAPANLHITTKFIGAWPEERLEELKRALTALPEYAAIPITVEKLGFFPNARSPRVFWAGIAGGPELQRLARDTDAALAKLGVIPEQRAFSPHLTLARIPDPPVSGLLDAIQQVTGTDFGSFEADRFHLYLSKPGPKGPVYTKLAEFPFRKV